MKETLIEEAEELGIEASMYYLLPPKKREATLKADIRKEKARREKSNGQARKI